MSTARRTSLVPGDMLSLRSDMGVHTVWLWDEHDRFDWNATPGTFSSHDTAIALATVTVDGVRMFRSLAFVMTSRGLFGWLPFDDVEAWDDP